MGIHDRIITPDTDPDRFTKDEAAIFREGRCSEVTEYGTGPEIVYCREPSAPGASFGHCALHNAELLIDYFPDGTRRHDIDYRDRPGYEQRVAAYELLLPDEDAP